LKSDKVAALDISTNDFVSPSFFPHDLATGSTAQPLVHGFISSNRVVDLVSQIKLKIIQHLIPGLRKDGYVEDAVDSSTNAGGSNPRQPTSAPPARPQAETPPYPLAGTYRPPSMFPDNPLEIGRRDLDPFPSNPFSPPSLFPHGEDGMFLGPDHPIFGAGRGRSPFGEVGPWGGDGFLPPMGAPPGARFDPVGPGPLPGRGVFGSPRGRGRGGPGRHLGDPDNDEFMPPGMVCLLVTHLSY
jgi:proteasome inhibitor subunit 1 (PI31)